LEQQAWYMQRTGNFAASSLPNSFAMKQSLDLTLRYVSHTIGIAFACLANRFETSSSQH
jgi:hypothetical protein